MADEIKKLFAQYYQPLVRRFLRQHKNQAISEELAQDVFERYIRLREQDPDQPGRYLYKIAERLDIDRRGRIAIKRRGETGSIDLMTRDGQLPDGLIVPDELHDFVLREQLSAVIAKLPEDERRAIAAYRQGDSVEQIAQREGCTSKVVRSRIESARRRLKRMLLHNPIRER